ncbi:MAG: 50S ribosomal protein L18e [Candidatus Micrarchaeaceae archaeon]
MKTNAEKSEVKEWLSTVEAASKGQHYPKLWKKVYRLIDVPSRKRSGVNLSKISQNTKEGDNVIVPGKVLATGEINHKVTISAMEFSGPALKALKEANCRIIGIKDIVKSDRICLII